MSQEVRQIVRIGDTDLDGFKPVAYALTKIRGYWHINGICNMQVLGNKPINQAGST